MHKQAFLAQLQQQAEKQAKLHHARFLPKSVDGLTSIIGRYPWQVLVVSSGVTAIVLEVIRAVSRSGVWQ